MSNNLKKKLVQIQVTYDGKGLKYSKPKFEKNDDAFALKDDGCKLQLYLDRSKLQFPVTLQFAMLTATGPNCDSNQYVISGLGFAKCTEGLAPPTPSKVTEQGTTMADCFELDDGVDALDVGVLNHGTDHKPGYSFKLWIRDPNTPNSEIDFDPRVYNHAEINPLEFKESFLDDQQAPLGAPAPGSEQASAPGATIDTGPTTRVGRAKAWGFFSWLGRLFRA